MEREKDFTKFFPSWTLNYARIRNRFSPARRDLHSPSTQNAPGRVTLVELPPLSVSIHDRR